MKRSTRRHTQRRMGAALFLAKLNHGLTGDNPSVGCVITNSDGAIIGVGVTGMGGRPHAEEIALEDAGVRAKGGTAYVTLEPCRTRSSGASSCAQKLVEAGIVRVVVAVEDPHPTARDGLAILRSAGVAVVLGPGQGAARQLYVDFFRKISA